MYDWRYYDEVLDAAAIHAALTTTPTITLTRTVSGTGVAALSTNLLLLPLAVQAGTFF